MKSTVLRVGDTITLKRGFLYKHNLLFAGMPWEGCFSLVVIWTSGYNSAAYNLFFPITQTELVVAGRKYVVEEVDSGKIRMRRAD